MKYYHCFNGVVEEHINCGLDAGKSHLVTSIDYYILTIETYLHVLLWNICFFELSAGKQELYDIGHNWCDHPERVDCGDRPICDEKDENCNEPSTPSTKSTPPMPDFECPQPNGYFADPTNCIKYYHCYENVVEERITCPKGIIISKIKVW